MFTRPWLAATKWASVELQLYSHEYSSHGVWEPLSLCARVCVCDTHWQAWRKLTLSLSNPINHSAGTISHTQNNSNVTAAQHNWFSLTDKKKKKKNPPYAFQSAGHLRPSCWNQFRSGFTHTHTHSRKEKRSRGYLGSPCLCVSHSTLFYEYPTRRYVHMLTRLLIIFWVSQRQPCRVLINYNNLSVRGSYSHNSVLLRFDCTVSQRTS